MAETITPVKVVTDLIDDGGERFEALLPLTVKIEDGQITLGSYNGPDLWRATLAELKGEQGG